MIMHGHLRQCPLGEEPTRERPTRDVSYASRALSAPQQLRNTPREPPPDEYTGVPSLSCSAERVCDRPAGTRDPERAIRNALPARDARRTHREHVRNATSGRRP